MDKRKRSKARLGLEKLDDRAVPAPVFFDPSGGLLLNRPVAGNPFAITRATFGPGVNSPFFNNGAGTLNLNRPVAGNPFAITRQVSVFNVGLPRGNAFGGRAALFNAARGFGR